MFHKFILFSCKVYELISFFAFFQFYPMVSRNGKAHYSADSLIIIIILLIEIFFLKA